MAASEMFVVCQGDEILTGPIPGDQSGLSIRRARTVWEYVSERTEVRPGQYSTRFVLRGRTELI